MTSKSLVRKMAVMLAVLAIIIAPGMCDRAYGESLGVDQHSKQEVVNKLKTGGSVNDPTEFSVVPVKDTVRGDLTPGTKQNALNLLNTIRYVAGVEPVSLDTNYGNLAQAGAFVNWSIGRLTHYPSQSTTQPAAMSNQDWQDGNTGAGKSNIAWGQRTLSAAVLDWMDDEDSSNVDRVGHRMWSINPKMGKTGFGASSNSNDYTERYFAEYSSDGSNSSGSQTNVAWPARYMPVEFFGNTIPWSLATGNTSISSESQISNVSVTLTRRSSSPSGSGQWTFSTSNTYTASNSGEFFKVQLNHPYTGYRGLPGPYVIFRPADISYQVGDIFDVSITGLGSQSIDYTVEFICGYPVESMSLDKEEYIVTGYEYPELSIQPATAKGYKVQWSSSNTNVVTVNQYGTIQKVNPGTATITATIDGKYTASGQPMTATATVRVPKSITSSNPDISVDFEKNHYYTGEEIIPDFTIKDGNKVLEKGTDYTVSVYDGPAIEPKANNFNYTAVITGKGDYYGNRYEGYWIFKRSLSSDMITLDPESAEYSGSLQKPGVTVKLGNKVLTQGVDYTLTNNGGTDKGTYTVRVNAVSGSNLYQGSASKNFTITAKSITDEMISISREEFTYNGNVQRPTVTVKNGSVTLTEGTHYTLTYSGGTDVGEYTVKVTGKNNYKDDVEKTYRITPKNLTESMVTLDSSELTYSGSVQKPTVTVKDGSKSLYENTDYTLENNGGTDVGSYSAKVTGKGNYAGVISKNYKINQKALSNSMISIQPSEFTYNGSLQKPEVTVKNGTLTLTEGTDYTLANAGGTNAGVYTITITGEGNYSGNADGTFKIKPASITGAEVTIANEPHTYDGTEKTPAVTGVKLNGETLDNSSYTVTYDNNTNAGTASVTVKGQGNYTGAAATSFTIDPKLITGEMVSLDPSEYTYTGKAITPKPVVTVGDKTLIEKTDYTVAYSDNINVGNGKATVTAKGNYTGSVPKDFTINKAPNSVTVKIKGWQQGKTANKPTATADFGASTAKFTYSTAIDGDYSDVVPSKKGSYFVKATIEETANYKGAESDPVAFAITAPQATQPPKITGKPTILNTIANSAKKTNDVIWNKSGVKGATNYELNWKSKDASKWSSTMVKNTVRGTTSGLTIGGLYSIRVRPVAYSADKKIRVNGQWSNTVYRYFHTTGKIRLSSNSKGSFTMSWAKNSAATGYQVMFTTNSNGSGAANNINTVGANATSFTKSGLKSGTTYYVQVREIKKVGSITYIGNISCPVAVKVK